MLTKHKDQDDYSSSRVPASERVSLLTTTLVRTGMTTALSQFMLGATLGHCMTLSQAMLATLAGSLILQVVSMAMGCAGAREGLSTCLLARWCGFGRIGSLLIGLAIIVSCLGWFGVQNTILATGLVQALPWAISPTTAAAISGLGLTLLVVLGFAGLAWTAKIALPLFFLVIGWLLFSQLQGHSLTGVVDALPVGEPLTLGAGATMVAGAAIVGALITPDITRYCRDSRQVFWMITVSYLVGEMVVNGIAIIVAKVLQTADVVVIMTQSAGWMGLLCVILSAVKVNDTALYSSSLALTNIMEVITGRHWRYASLTLVMGAIGTSLSILGIMQRFTSFLVMLGVLFPPIAGVMMVDYFLLRTERKTLDASRKLGQLPAHTKTIGWPAMIAWVGGCCAGFIITGGIASLNALLVSCCLYTLLAYWAARQRTDSQA